MPKPGKRKPDKGKAKQKSKEVKLDEEVTNKMDLAGANEGNPEEVKIKEEPEEPNSSQNLEPQSVEVEENFTMNFEENVKTEEELEDKRNVWIQKIREIKGHKVFETITDFKAYFDYFEEKAEISQIREFVENMQKYLQNFHCSCGCDGPKHPMLFAMENTDFLKLLLDTKLTTFVKLFDPLFDPDNQREGGLGYIEKLLNFALNHGIQMPNIEEYFEKACLAGATTAVDELVQLRSKMNLNLDLKKNLENTLRDFESVDEEFQASQKRVGSVESLLRSDIDYGEQLYQKSFLFACDHKHWKFDRDPFKPSKNAIEVAHSKHKGMWRRMDPYGGMRFDFTCVQYSRMPGVCEARKSVCQLLREKHKEVKYQGLLGLHHACLNQDTDLVDYLLEHIRFFEQDPTATLDSDRMTPVLDYAIKYSNKVLLETILTFGIKLEFSKKNLLMACRSQKSIILDFMLEYGKNNGLEIRPMFHFVKENGDISVFVAGSSKKFKVGKKSSEIVLKHFDVSDKDFEQVEEFEDVGDEVSENSHDDDEEEESSDEQSADEEDITFMGSDGQCILM